MRQPHSALSLLAQADVVFLASRLLRPPQSQPSGWWIDALEAQDQLMACAGFAGSTTFRSALRQALAAAAAATTQQWSHEYYRLFEGVMMCPPCETAYVRRDKGAVIGDVSGFYRAFGFRIRDEVGEKPDHVVSQLEFMALLLAMEATAADVPSHGREVIVDAMVEFADCHLGEWLTLFAARLELVTDLPVLTATANLLRELWSELAAVHGLRALPSSLEMPDPDPEEPYECGMAGAGDPAVPVSVGIRRAERQRMS